MLNVLCGGFFRRPLVLCPLLAFCLNVSVFAGHWTDRTQLVAHWPLNDHGSQAADTLGRQPGAYRNGVQQRQPGGVRGSADTCITMDGQDDVVLIPHNAAFRLSAGTLSLLFNAHSLKRRQALLSADATGNAKGGHVTVWVDDRRVAVRLQSKTKSYILESARIGAGWHHVAVSFGRKGLQLFVDGRSEARHKFSGGLQANREPIVLGASAIHSSSGQHDHLEDHYRGQLDDVLLFGEQLPDDQIFALAQATAFAYDVPKLSDFASVDAAYTALKPMAWWSLKPNSTDTLAADHMGRFPGRVAGVVSPFNGRDEHVDVGCPDLHGQAMTILGWVSAYHFKTADARIVSKATGTDVDDHYWMLSTVADQGNIRLRFRLKADGQTKELIGSRGQLHADKRIFAAAVYDGKQIRLYQDGELVGRTAHTGTIDANPQVHAWIGDNPSGIGSRPFAGSLQDIAIFDHALSAADIRSVFVAAQRKQPLTPSRAATLSVGLAHEKTGNPLTAAGAMKPFRLRIVPRQSLAAVCPCD